MDDEFTIETPVEQLTPEQARAEYQEMAKDEKFFQGGYSFEGQQAKVKRWTALYERAFPEKMAEAHEIDQAENKALFIELKKHGVTEETLKEDEQKRREEADKEAMAQARMELERHFGGEQEATFALNSAKTVLDRFAKPEDLVFLEETGLGNDPEFIKILVELDAILKRAKWGKR